MEKGFLQVQKVTPSAILPSRATEGSVGYDLFASGPVIVDPYGGRARVPTGLIIIIPDGHYGRIAPRSGLTVRHGIHVGAGVIDPDYRGLIEVVLFNLGEEEFHIKAGDKIAQLILEKVSILPVVEVDKVDETTRGEGGFGSTDNKKIKL